MLRSAWEWVHELPESGRFSEGVAAVEAEASKWFVEDYSNGFWIDRFCTATTLGYILSSERQYPPIIHERSLSDAQFKEAEARMIRMSFEELEDRRVLDMLLNTLDYERVQVKPPVRWFVE